MVTVLGCEVPTSHCGSSPAHGLRTQGRLRAVGTSLSGAPVVLGVPPGHTTERVVMLHRLVLVRAE